MHIIIEEARKAAGISGFSKNYPDDPKQRGCGYWAAFLGSINQSLAKADSIEIQEAKESERTAKAHSAELREAHERIEKQDDQIRSLLAKNSAKGVEILRQQEGWSIEKGREASALINN